MYSEKSNTFVSKSPIKNTLKEKTNLKKQTLGTFVEMGGRGGIECLARGGFDFLILDAEHGPFSIESIGQHIDTAELNNITALVRISEVSRSNILRTLDVGAKGIIIPYIESVDQVKEVIKHAKFSPLGQRGYCPTKSSCWGVDKWAEDGRKYMKLCNEETLVLPQCETLGAYENIEEILALEGVDGIFIGPLDLSIALGVPFELESPILQKAIRDVLMACKKANKLSFIFSSNPDKAKAYFTMGFDAVAYSLDASIFVNACKQAVDACKPE